MRTSLSNEAILMSNPLAKITHQNIARDYATTLRRSRMPRPTEMHRRHINTIGGVIETNDLINVKPLPVQHRSPYNDNLGLHRSAALHLQRIVLLPRGVSWAISRLYPSRYAPIAAYDPCPPSRLTVRC